jgi:hypothetical protein
MSVATARLALSDPDLDSAYRLLQPGGYRGFQATIDLAQTGNPAAETAACVDLRNGYGLIPDAAGWCKDAATQGYALGEYEYGQIYYHYELAFNALDDHELRQQLAVHWMKQAAKHGIVQADFALIRANALGEGVVVNKDLALFYLQEARKRLATNQNPVYRLLDAPAFRLMLGPTPQVSIPQPRPEDIRGVKAA